MRTLKHRALGLVTIQILAWTAVSGPAVAQPKIDGDQPGYSAGAEVASTAEGNPLDQGDWIYSIWGSYRTRAGYWGINGSLGYAEPTSPFARSLGRSELWLVDFSLVRYLGYPPQIDRTCGGKQAASGHLQPWHCGRRLKSEPYVFAGPGLALLQVDDASPDLPLPDASEDYFTVNFGVGVRLYRLMIEDSQELAPGLSYQAGYRRSRWYLRPEIKGRWFTGGEDEIDWTVGIGIGYNFDRGSTHGALCMQVEESCYLAQQVAGLRPSPLTGQAEDPALGDEYFADLVERREQLEDYRMRLGDFEARCGKCIDESIALVNEALDRLRRPGDAE